MYEIKPESSTSCSCNSPRGGLKGGNVPFHCCYCCYCCLLTVVTVVIVVTVPVVTVVSVVTVVIFLLLLNYNIISLRRNVV